MLGKIIALGTYCQHAVNVYVLKRYPSTKLPLWGINTVLFFSFIYGRHLYWKAKTQMLKNNCLKGISN